MKESWGRLRIVLGLILLAGAVCACKPETEEVRPKDWPPVVPKPLPPSPRPDWAMTPAFEVRMAYSPEARRYLTQGDGIGVNTRIFFTANDAGLPYADNMRGIDLLPEETVVVHGEPVARFSSRRYDRGLMRFARDGTAIIVVQTFSYAKRQDHYLDCTGEVPSGELFAGTKDKYQLYCDVAPIE